MSRATANSRDTILFVAGTALAIGGFGVVITSILYALSPSVAALPMPNPSFADALSATIAGRHTMVAAGIIGVISDLILIAGALLMTVFRKPASLQVEKLGWILVVLSVLLFVVVDALAAGVLFQLAQYGTIGTGFAGAKLLFDTFFIFGTITFGIGAPIILACELRAASPILSKSFAWIGIGVALAALVSGCLYFVGVNLSRVIGISVALEALLFAIYGLRIAFRSSRTAVE